MLKKVASLFYKDIGWKLLSIAAAFVLWLICITMTDQVINEDFVTTLIPSNIDVLLRDDITVLNLEALENTEVTVGVRAKSSEIEKLRNNPSLIEASVDLRNVKADEVHASGNPVYFQASVNVDIDLPDADRRYVSPDTFTVRLDNYVSESFNIQVSEIGEVAEGYELIDSGSKNSAVVLSAAKSVIDRVYEVRVSVDIMDTEGSISHFAKLSAYDRDINDITSEVEMSIEETEVYATVLPYKEVPLAVEPDGEPAYGYMATEIKILPEKIFVVGSREVLDATDVLYLPSPDLTGIKESVEVKSDIRQALPENLRLRQGDIADATVSVTVEPVVSREYSYPIDLLEATGYIGSGYAARILNMETVPIIIQGSESAMASMDVSRINAKFSLRGLEVGEHSINLSVTLPSGIKLMNSPTVNVEIYEIPPEDVPVPEDFTNIDGESQGGDNLEESTEVYRIDAATGEMVGVPAEDVPEEDIPEDTESAEAVPADDIQEDTVPVAATPDEDLSE